MPLRYSLGQIQVLPRTASQTRMVPCTCCCKAHTLAELFPLAPHARCVTSLGCTPHLVPKVRVQEVQHGKQRVHLCRISSAILSAHQNGAPCARTARTGGAAQRARRRPHTGPPASSTSRLLGPPGRRCCQGRCTAGSTSSCPPTAAGWSRLSTGSHEARPPAATAGHIALCCQLACVRTCRCTEQASATSE
jgi:hypothetical protein